MRGCECTNLRYREHRWVEEHGESCFESWNVCVDCGWIWTDAELREREEVAA